ncbi:MAG TPA: alcohol dehydrogenase catalytic domain-containing protein, partial [Anaerolineales bacterium]
MTADIPESMHAAQLDQDGGPLQVRRISVPRPGPGEVLIRMAASPINPSDLGFLSGGYGEEKTFPVVPGLEGSGTVIASGSGLLPKLLVGRRVACTKSAHAGGAWAEYMIARASACVPLRHWISLEQGAMLVVNPLTVLAFFDIAKQGQHAAIVNTAAASQLGRMLLRLSLRRGVPLINVVRKPEQAEILSGLGATHVLVSREPDFQRKLRSLTHELSATLILDAVAGGFTQQLIDAAPQRSLILLYSMLSGQAARINPNSIWYDEIRVEGFHL